MQKYGQSPDGFLGLIVPNGRRDGGQIVGHIAVGVGAPNEVKGQRPNHAEEEASQGQTKSHQCQSRKGKPEEDAFGITEALVSRQHLTFGVGGLRGVLVGLGSSAALAPHFSVPRSQIN